MNPTIKPVSFALSALALLVLAVPLSAQNKLIELIPDDAVAALYIDRPQRALPAALTMPFIQALTEDKAVTRQLTEAVKKIPGPMLIGAIMPPPKQDEPDIFIVMQKTDPAVDFDDLIEKTFLPALNRLLKPDGGAPLKLEKGKSGSRILDPAGNRTVLTYAVKERLLVASTQSQLSLRWARGEWPEARWLDLPGVRKLLRKLPKTSNLRVLFNPDPLVKAIPKPAPNSAEELALKIGSPADFLAGAADLTWKKSSFRLCFTVALADECHGLARVLTRATTPARVLGVFPEDYLALGRIGWGSAADLADGAYALTDRFDDSISAEYREELAEFRQETGVDWDTGLLGNLVGEMAFGVRVDFAHTPPVGWAAVFPLGDEAAFRVQFDKLIAHFDLPFEEEERDGLLIRKTAANAIPPQGLHLTIERGLLIAGSDTDTVTEIARRAASEKKPLPAGANLRRCYEELGDPNHAAVLFDVERLYKSAPLLVVAAGSEYAPFISQGMAGMAVSMEEQTARLDFYWSLTSPGAPPKPEWSTVKEPRATQALVLVARSLASSLAQARNQARQVVSMSNMRSIGQSFYLYAEGHKGAFPESLLDLLRSQPDAVSLKMFISPYDGQGPRTIDEIATQGCYLYRPGLTTASPPDTVILAEREVHDGGACFLFLDGHVARIPDPRASELIEEIKAAAAGKD